MTLVSRLATVVLLAAAMFVTAAKAETVLKFVPHADVKVLDPIWTTSYITRNHAYMVYDTLFAMDANLKPQPQMVETYSVSDDKLTYTFKLREGLLFHDLSPVTSKDCIASLKRWGSRDIAGRRLLASTVSMNVIDDRSFSIVLKEPYSFVIESLGQLSSNVPVIMRAAEAATPGDQQITNVIGSGPFKFERSEWVQGSKLVYTKFAEYKPRPEPASLASGGKVVHVDRVEWIYIPDASTAVSALNSGEVDWVEAPIFDLFPVLEANPKIKVTALDPLGSIGSLRFNHLHPPFDNEAARRAVMMAIDQADYMNALVGDKRYWRYCSSYLGCGTPYELEAPDKLLHEAKLEQAKALWKKSGYEGEPIVVLDTVEVAMNHAQTLVTAQVLRDLGATVDVRAMDLGTYLEVRAKKDAPSKGGWNIFHSWGMVAQGASPLTGALDNSGPTSSQGWPYDEASEKIRLSWFAAKTEEEKKSIAVALQRRNFDFVPWLPTGQFILPTAFQTKVKDILVSPIPFLWNLRKEG